MRGKGSTIILITDALFDLKLIVMTFFSINAACVLWGHIPAAEYRKVIIGLIFLRYISAAFDKRYRELIEEGDGFEDDRDAYAMDNIFFVPEEARWNTIASAAHTAEIGTVIDNAMRAIETEYSWD